MCPSFQPVRRGDAAHRPRVLKQLMKQWRFCLEDQGVRFVNRRSNGRRLVEVFLQPLPVTRVTGGDAEPPGVGKKPGCAPVRPLSAPGAARWRNHPPRPGKGLCGAAGGRFWGETAGLGEAGKTGGEGNRRPCRSLRPWQELRGTQNLSRSRQETSGIKAFFPDFSPGASRSAWLSLPGAKEGGAVRLPARSARGGPHWGPSPPPAPGYRYRQGMRRERRLHMAKPRKRKQTLTVRLTEQEKERIQTQAKKARGAGVHRLPWWPWSWETPICLGPDTRPLLVELKRNGQQREPNRPEGKRRGLSTSYNLPRGGGPAGRIARRAVPPYQEQPMATVMYIPEKKQSPGGH